MEKRGQSDVKYKELSILEETSEEVNRKIYKTIYSRRGSIKECGKVQTIGLYRNLSSGKY